MNDAKIEVLEELIDLLGGGDILARLQKRASAKKDSKEHEDAESALEEKEEEKKPFGDED